MTNKSRIKMIIIFIFLAILSAALYLTSQRPKWDIGWGKGLISISERNYYSNRINRTIKYWQQTAHEVYDYNKDQFPESYQTYLIIDLEKKALWIEKNGHIRTENYIELSPETKWSLYHITPKGHTELSDRTAIKIRGLAGNLLTPESFRLVGNVINGYLLVDFNSYYVNSYYNSGSFVMRSVNFQSPTGSADKIYPSIIVTDDEYKQYHDTITDSNAVVTENKKIKAWNKIEKYLYMEIERQILKTFYRLGNISIEPGPDYSAAHAFINIRKKNILEKITGHRSKNHAFSINIDHLGDDIWYGKSFPELYSDPSKSEENKPVLDIEFLASPNGFIKSSKRKEFLKKGREFQLAAAIPESKWKAILPDGKTIEFIGICDNPTVNKQWWGPDGNPLDFAPYISTESYKIYKENRKCYEMAWRVTPESVTPFILEGSNEVYGIHIIRDRYGSSVINKMTADSFSFDNSRNVTSLKIGYNNSNWKTALEIKDEQGEIQFLDKYRVMIIPPKIERDKVVIQCYEELSTLINYDTDFAIVVNEGSETKTISLNEYQRSYSDSRDSGLSTYRYMIQDLDISQIESVCFRYRPYGAIFKNISLVPGQNQGFEIEVIEAEEDIFTGEDSHDK